MADSDLDMASRDCLSCCDTDDVSVQTAQKKYRKRLRASCKLSKGSDWTETQMKRIGDSHQDIWGHDHKIIRTEWKTHSSREHTSFEMKRMTTRTDQLVRIARATGCKIYTRESEVETCGLTKALVLSLKQFHAHFYRVYEKEPSGHWWASKAYTLVIPSGILIYQQAWVLSHSAHGVSNLEGIPR